MEYLSENICLAQKRKLFDPTQNKKTETVISSASKISNNISDKYINIPYKEFFTKQKAQIQEMWFCDTDLGKLEVSLCAQEK